MVYKNDGGGIQQSIQSYQSEVEILSGLDHPNVLKLFGVLVDESTLSIVTELIPRGSLFDLIHSKTPVNFTPKSVAVIGSGICAGMTYLHRRGIVHRDLKPANLLLGSETTGGAPQLIVKIADFGHARVMPSCCVSSCPVPPSDPPHILSIPSPESLSRSSSTSADHASSGPQTSWSVDAPASKAVGTWQYAAPEVLRGEPHDTSADVFSFGVVLWEIHARAVPHSASDPAEARAACAAERGRLPRPKLCGDQLWAVTEECWGPPAQRPSFAQLEERMASIEAAAQPEAESSCVSCCSRAVAVRG